MCSSVRPTLLVDKVMVWPMLFLRNDPFKFRNQLFLSNIFTEKISPPCLDATASFYLLRVNNDDGSDCGGGGGGGVDRLLFRISFHICRFI